MDTWGVGEWIGVAVVLVLGGITLYFARTLVLLKLRERRLLSLPCSIEWRDILSEHMPLYRVLADRWHPRFEELVKRFLATKHFEACGGLSEVTEAMRVTTAGNACLLLLGREDDGWVYPSLKTILMYPDTFVRPGEEDGDKDVALLGESWGTGSVILSWQALLEDKDAGTDGFNLVFHEFSHQLDQEFALADGLPELESAKHYKEWAETFTEAYEEHRSLTNGGRERVIDAYGATNPAEFFSCATEVFFEQPRDLRRELPDVYEQLERYYGLDPSQWGHAK